MLGVNKLFTLFAGNCHSLSETPCSMRLKSEFDIFSLACFKWLANKRVELSNSAWKP